MQKTTSNPTAPTPPQHQLDREEWIAEFLACIARVPTAERPTSSHVMAASNWEMANHREPANVVQDMLIADYLKRRDCKNPPDDARLQAAGDSQPAFG